MKTRILHVHNYSNWGGNLEHVWLVLHGLASSRFDLYMAAPPGEEYLGRFRELDIQLLPFEARSRSDGFAVLQLTALIRTHRIDLIHSHLRRTDWICCLARLLCPGRKWVTTVHGEINRSSDFSRAKGVRNWLYGRLLARGFHKVLTVSRALADQLEVEESVQRAKLLHIINGIAVERFQFVSPAARCRCKAALDIEPTDRVVIQIGRFGKRKGHAVLLRALAENVRREKPWVCFFIGDGDEEVRCRRLAASLGLARWVYFWGYQDDVRPYLSAADVLVMPSFSEGLPRALLEGMAMGLCPVASDIGGVREALEAPNFGLTFPAGDHRALEAILASLWSQPDQVRRLGALARQRVEHTYSADTLVNMQANCYREVLGL